MYMKWDEIKEKYPNKWVLLAGAEFADKFHVHLLGGEIFYMADSQDDVCANIPDDDGRLYACIHTSEGAYADGLLKSFV
jgi:hypothetical protein